jgi:hypothetical protein
MSHVSHKDVDNAATGDLLYDDLVSSMGVVEVFGDTLWRAKIVVGIPGRQRPWSFTRDAAIWKEGSSSATPHLLLQ